METKKLSIQQKHDERMEIVMADEAKQPQDINMDALTPKGKLHAEQYQQMQVQKIKHQLEIEKIDVLLKYYETTIPKEISETTPEEAPKDDK
jgi:sortase (surface protein transpeptidase)